MFLNAIIFSKLQKLYEEIDTDKDPYFLVFAPITLNFSNIEFNFLNPNPSSADDIRQNAANEMAFSVCANAVARDPKILQLNADEMLQDAYSKILNNAILVDTTVSDEDRATFNNAKAVLYINDNFDPTPEYSKYKEVQAKVTDVENQIIAVNTSLSENVNDQNLLQQKQQLELQKSIVINDWIINGNKNEIEDALKIVSGLNERSAFKSNFFDEVGNLKSALNLQSTINSDIEYLPTFCLPQNIYQYDFNGWVKISMLNDEITSIENDAKAFLGEEMYNTYNSTSAPLTKIEFEYLFVTIQRSWFNKDMINSSFWKFKDGNTAIVSDGVNENVGILPAYFDKFIFVRRVVQYISQNPGAPPSEISNPVTPILKFVDIAKLTDFSKLKSMQPQPAFQAKMRIASDVSQKEQPVLIMQHVKAAPAAPAVATVHVSSILPGEWNPDHKFTPPGEHQSGKVVILSHVPVGVATQSSPITPPPPFPIVFVFVDSENNSITSLDISLKNVDKGTDYSTLTDSTGKASFANMVSGNYDLNIIDSEVFENFENKYNINSSLTITVTLVKRANPKFNMLLMGAINYQFPKLPNPLGDYTYS